MTTTMGDRWRLVLQQNGRPESVSRSHLSPEGEPIGLGTWGGLHRVAGSRGGRGAPEPEAGFRARVEAGSAMLTYRQVEERARSQPVWTEGDEARAAELRAQGARITEEERGELRVLIQREINESIRRRNGGRA